MFVTDWAVAARAGIPVIICFLFVASTASAQNSGPPKLTIDFSLYPYQRTVKNDVDFTTTINANLPGRFSYFSYVNFKGVVSDGSPVFDRSEQNLRFALSDSLPLDLNIQGVLVHGDGNDFYQLGVGWRVDDTPGWQEFFDRINLMYRFTLHLKRFGADDPGAWGVEHWFRFTFPGISDRLYLSGFMDQTFNEELPASMPSNPLVGEVQLGVRIWNRFYAITEYRVNQRRVGDEYNLAVGLEYKFRW
jgi:hypothetical protein